MQAPDFWWRSSWQGTLLAPLGCAYALGARLRRRGARPQRAALPVICVGNLVAGGAGKTPTALAVADRLALFGRRPAFLSRGYGGRLQGPLLVHPEVHGAVEVGDEPLLLARRGPCVVARDRVAGAAFAAATEIPAGRGGRLAKPGVLVMDDGFQNPRLEKTLSLLVVDGGQGFGNGRVLPAGPLREPLADGLARADAVVLIGEDEAGVAATLAPLLGDKPLLRARLAPRGPRLTGMQVLAFAGIGRPEKFFATLREHGAELRDTRAFPDHHVYGPNELSALRRAAQAMGVRLMTTEKDLARLPPAERTGIDALPVDLIFAEQRALDRLLKEALDRG